MNLCLTLCLNSHCSRQVFRDPHIAAFSVPVFGEGNKLLAALALTGPASRLTQSMRDSEMGKLMKEAACRLSVKSGAHKVMCDNVYKI